MAKRPAESLVAAIDYHLKHGGGTPTTRTISLSTLRRWRALAKSIDGRMRLDGSKLNRRKGAK